MASIIHGHRIHGHRRSFSPAAGIYLAVLVVTLVIVVTATTIWLSTDNNSGTNALATDEQSITRVP